MYKLLDKIFVSAHNNLSIFLDISAADYLKEKLSDSVDGMPEYLADIFLQEIGVARFMQSTPCSRMAVPYYPNVDGWNKSKFLVAL